MRPEDATEQAYKNGYEDGKRDAVKHGWWIEKYHENPLGGFFRFHCSECAASKPVAITTNFCSNCGARMDGDGNG